MSSLTIWIAEWRELHPSSPGVGLKMRTLARPGSRTSPSCRCDSSAPSRSSGVRSARSCASSRWKYSRGDGRDPLLAGRLQPRGGQREHGIDTVVHRLG